jgi:hypothetical protein
MVEIGGWGGCRHRCFQERPWLLGVGEERLVSPKRNVHNPNGEMLQHFSVVIIVG